MDYKFYGWEHADCAPINRIYPGIETPHDLYDALWSLWSKETCAPSLRPAWTAENRTLGQCSITAFLAQDIFGGKVMGTPLPDGALHCYNVVGDCVFDLTSEQFQGKPVEYALENEQLREAHFARQEKLERYEQLKSGLARKTAAKTEK